MKLNQQHIKIALGLTIVGVLYLAYTKYVEFEQRQERLENNLRNVIDAVNNHYLSQMGDTDSETEMEAKIEAEAEAVAECVSECVDSAVKRVVFEEDSEPESDVMPSCMVEEHDNDVFSEAESDSPIIITKNSHCIYTITMGKNKGSRCGKNATQDGYCKLHLKHIPTPM